MTRTPMSTITRPTTRMAYWANAINVPADRLASGSSASSPRASPEASCHDEVGAPPLSFFLESGCATAPSLLVLTTDHEPAEVADAAGATGSAGGIGSAGRGLGGWNRLGGLLGAAVRSHGPLPRRADLVLDLRTPG